MLLGRPNVGKSALFNRLTGSRRALVRDTPGSHVTRDWRSSRGGKLADLRFEVVDTSGLEEQQQQQQQQQHRAWASPVPQPMQNSKYNDNSRRLSFPCPKHAPPPLPLQLPPGGVDDCYRDLTRQQEACDWADEMNRLAFTEVMKRRQEGGGGGGAGGLEESRNLFSSSSSTSVDESRFFDYPASSPDPTLIDPESLSVALYEPVKVFCVEVPVDNPVSNSTAATGSSTISSFSASDRPTHYRRFVAASYPALLRRYLSETAASTGGRHVYEVLRDSRPCHAYFDVEFAKSANPGVDGDGIVDALVAALRSELAALVGEGAARAALVLESDSTTATKFSRHLLIRLPGSLAFRDNAAVGKLLGEALSRDGAAARLRVAKAESGGAGAAPFSSPVNPNSRLAQITARPQAASTWVADTAVYTKNRHFRVLWSSKGGKNVSLEPTSRYSHGEGAPLDAAANPRRTLLLCNLAANVEPGTRLIDVSPGGGGSGRVAIAGVVSGSGHGFGGGGGGRGASASNGGGTAAAAAPRLIRREKDITRSNGSVIKLEWKHHAADLRQAGGENSYDPQQQQQEPDPRLVEAAFAAVPFVEELAVKRAGSTAPGASVGDAYVRAVVVVGPVGGASGAAAAAATTAVAAKEGITLPPLRSAVVAFSLLGKASNWCEFVGRRHRSNHAYFVLDFGAGSWVQKCYDPDCAGKKGNAGVLPEGMRLQVEKE